MKLTSLLFTLSAALFAAEPHYGYLDFSPSVHPLCVNFAVLTFLTALLCRPWVAFMTGGVLLLIECCLHGARHQDGPLFVLLAAAILCLGCGLANAFHHDFD